MNFEDNARLFIEEAKELLASLEKGFLELEEHPERENLVHDIFRSLHTIKGSGAMFGFDAVAEFTHNVENLFDDIRKGILAVSPEVIGVGLRSVDLITDLIDNPTQAEGEEAILADIAAIRDRGKPSLAGARQEPETSVPALAGKRLPQVFRIRIKPSLSLLHRGVKLESLFRELEEMGPYHAVADLGAVPKLEELDPTSLHLSWTITLSTTESLQALRSVFMFIEDYAEISIAEITPEEGAEGPVLPRLGEVLANRGAMPVEAIEEIRQAQKPFGEVAVEKGRVTREELEGALVEQQLVKSVSVEREARQESSTIRVRREKLDFLVDSVGELVILQARLAQEARKSGLAVFEGISENLGRLATTLRDSSMGIRMVPLAESFASFQRLVRDLSKQLGKELHLDIEGGDTELDKNITEALKDPLVHIIRNSADHGIETAEIREKKGKPRVGTIMVSARQLGSSVEIAISDDGAGLDLRKIKAKAVEKRLLDPTESDRDKIISMIMEPGFSTAERTTSLSGRGVGMDVVKTNIERLRGTVSISTEEGRGTTISLLIPLTLVIVDGLLVRVGGVDYVMDLSLVEECVDHGDDDISSGGMEDIIHLRGRTIPVLDLHKRLAGKEAVADADTRLVIATVDGTEVAFKVDMIVGKQQVVIKPFSASLKGLPAISGATILGDGSVALILNVAELVKSSQADAHAS